MDHDVFSTEIPEYKHSRRGTGSQDALGGDLRHTSHSYYRDSNLLKIQIPLSKFLACLMGFNLGLVNGVCGVDKTE